MSDNKDVFALLEELHASCKNQAPIKSEQAIFNLQEASKKALAANIDGHYEDYRQLYVINDLINNLVDSLYTVWFFICFSKKWTSGIKFILRVAFVTILQIAWLVKKLLSLQESSGTLEVTRILNLVGSPIM